MGLVPGVGADRLTAGPRGQRGPEAVQQVHEVPPRWCTLCGQGVRRSAQIYSGTVEWLHAVRCRRHTQNRFIWCVLLPRCIDVKLYAECVECGMIIWISAACDCCHAPARTIRPARNAPAPSPTQRHVSRPSAGLRHRAGETPIGAVVATSAVAVHFGHTIAVAADRTRCARLGGPRRVLRQASRWRRATGPGLCHRA